MNVFIDDTPSVVKRRRILSVLSSIRCMINVNFGNILVIAIWSPSGQTKKKFYEIILQLSMEKYDAFKNLYNFAENQSFSVKESTLKVAF